MKRQNLENPMVQKSSPVKKTTREVIIFGAFHNISHRLRQFQFFVLDALNSLSSGYAIRYAKVVRIHAYALHANS